VSFDFAHHARPIALVIDLVDPASQRIASPSVDEARRRLLAGDPAAVLAIEGSFALVAREGQRVCLARSLDRPMRDHCRSPQQHPRCG